MKGASRICVLRVNLWGSVGATKLDRTLVPLLRSTWYGGVWCMEERSFLGTRKAQADMQSDLRPMRHVQAQALQYCNRAAAEVAQQ